MKTIQTLLWVLTVGSTALARPVAYWPYDKLTREADLIVIATPVSVRDTGQETTLPGIFRDTGPIPAIDMETTFEVLATFKGQASLKQIVFHHLREANPPQMSVNGPMLVSFDPKEKKRYLLFLRQEEDGRYSSMTGQTDPAGAVKDLGKYP